MTSYTVHLFREMRLTLSAIEAATPEAAARLAATMPTYSADEIDDCVGFTYSAQVPRAGEESLLVHLRADGGEIEPASERVTNRDRAAWAEAALSVFIQHTGCDRDDALGDLLGDLMHWSERHDVDFDLALDRARGHFEAELAAELPPPPDAREQAASTLLGALHYVRAVLKLRHLDEATDEEVEEALRIADSAVALAEGGAQ